MKFEDNLKKRRRLAKISQEKLAEEMQVSRQTVSKWENGESYPSTKHIFMLSEILNCDIDHLVKKEPTDDTTLNKKTPHKKEKPAYKRYFYVTIGAVSALFIILFSFGLILNYRTDNDARINDLKIAVFDKMIDGSLNNVVNDFAIDGFIKPKIVGYGVTKKSGMFFIKYSLVDRNSNGPCSAIVYFYKEKDNYVYKCQYLGDANYLPDGDYYKIG